MRKLIVPGAALALLAGCTQAQIDRANVYQSQIAGACSVAMSLSAFAGPIAPYILAGCGTEAMIAKLALDPSSLAWVNDLVAKVKGLRD